jgi:subtilisin family serine protease
MIHQLTLANTPHRLERLEIDAVHTEHIRRALRTVDHQTLFAALPAELQSVRGVNHWTFRKSGWHFVPSKSSSTLAHMRVDTGDAPRSPVYLHESGQLLVGTTRAVCKLMKELSLDQCREILATFGASIVRDLKFAPNLFLVDLPATDEPLQLVSEIGAAEGVIYAEPELLQHIQQHAVDPEIAKQWHLENAEVRGGVHCDVGATKAWNISTGRSTAVAVIDFGFTLDPDDLNTAVADETAAAFIPTPDGDATFTQGRAAIPPDSHGTFCAGMAIARRGNGAPGAGVAPDAELIPIACPFSDVGSQLTLARALAYAAVPQCEIDGPARGADVISCSLGVGNRPWILRQVLVDALTFVAEQGRGGLGTPVFWAVANSPSPIAADEVCSTDLVVPVGATNRHDVAGSHAYGPKLACVAPGNGVFGILGSNNLYPASGTSFAAPCAASVAALVIGAAPALPRTKVIDIVCSTCDQVPYDDNGTLLETYDAGGHSDRYGRGRVNAEKAVAKAIAASAAI